jgi:cytochrome oxidase assembly protein ShyY1
MTYLELDPSAGVWVNRGWLAATQDASTAIAPPTAPGGTVEVTGYTRSFEASGPTPTDLPIGQVTRVSLNQLPTLPGVISDFWIQSASNEDGLTNVPLPEVDESRNISYAMQWLLFAIVAMGGWYVFLRREARNEVQSTTPN